MPTSVKRSDMKTSLARSAGYLAAAIWAAMAILQAYWALGGRWSVRAVLGEGNPVPPPLVLWLAVVVPLAAALIVLGRMGVWGTRLPGWIFKWGTWAMTAVLVLVSILNFVSGSAWELFLGGFALFFALLCAIVALLKAPSARSGGKVGNDPAGTMGEEDLVMGTSQSLAGKASQTNSTPWRGHSCCTSCPGC